MKTPNIPQKNNEGYGIIPGDEMRDMEFMDSPYTLIILALLLKRLT